MVYFYQNQGPAYAWLKDNLTAQQASEIDSNWIFQGKWQPEQQLQQIRLWLQQAPAQTQNQAEAQK
mgnify:CR=1 FL=1